MRDEHPLIITCAITGAETTRERQPHLPITPEEQARSAREAVQAGASVIHLHVRDDHGKPTQDLSRFREAIHAIRSAAPGVVVQISTGGAVGEPIENRAAPLGLKPEMASLNLGTMNFGDDVFMNHPRDIAFLSAKMRTFGVMPELEVYEVGMLESAFRMAKAGALDSPMHFQFVLGVPGGMSGEPENLLYLVSRHRTLAAGSPAHWGVAGIGRYEFPLAEQAIELGGHVRVGFEDNIFLAKGQLASSNAELVEKVAGMARKRGRKIATPGETRKMLGLQTK